MEATMYVGKMKGALTGTQNARAEGRPSDGKLFITGCILLLIAFFTAGAALGFCEGKNAELLGAGIELDKIVR